MYFYEFFKKDIRDYLANIIDEIDEYIKEHNKISRKLKWLYGEDSPYCKFDRDNGNLFFGEELYNNTQLKIESKFETKLNITLYEAIKIAIFKNIPFSRVIFDDKTSSYIFYDSSDEITCKIDVNGLVIDYTTYPTSQMQLTLEGLYKILLTPTPPRDIEW